MRFTVLGPPRSKKNSMRLVRVRGRTIPIPSKPYAAWLKSAEPQLRLQNAGAPPLTCRCQLAATFYRQRRTGDLDNFIAGLMDALQKANIIANDRHVVSFDGSRLDWDPKLPRIEFELSATS